MTTRPMVTVAHDGIDGTAVVPASALPRMTGQGWRRVDDGEAPAKKTTAPRRGAAKKAPAKKKATPAPKKPVEQGATTNNKE